MMQYIMKRVHESLWKEIVGEPEAWKLDLIHGIEFHVGILECIRNRDTKKARSIMIKRFNELQERIR